MRPFVPGGALVLAFLLAAAPAVPQEPDVPRLMERLLKDEKPSQRRAAAAALKQLGPKAARAVPALITALKDMDNSVRDEAEEALKKIGGPAVPALVEAIKDKDEFVRLRIVDTLGVIGPEAKEALPALQEAMSDTSQFVRDAAREAAIRVRSDVKTLAAQLKSKEDEERLNAVRTLAMLGPLARPAVPALADVLRDRNKDIRRETARTLAKLGRDASPAVAKLSAALLDPDEQTRLLSIQALGEIGPAAAPALPALQRAYKANAKSDEIKEAILEASKKIQARPSKP